MNLQSLMKQAQSMQKNIMNAKSKIDSTIFEGTSEFVSVKMYGNKKVKEVKIKKDGLEQDDIEILEDMIMIAVNDALTKIEKETNDKLGTQANMLNGLL